MQELEDIEEREQVGWGFWVRWVLASSVGLAVGLTVGILLAGFIAFIIISILGGSSFNALIPAPGGALLGATIGIAQWLVLRRKVSWAGSWVLATIVGAGVSVAVVLPAIDDMYGKLGLDGGLLLAASVGMALSQWLVLRRQFSRAGWWILASTVGFTVVLAGIVGGSRVSLTVYGAITGGAMVWLLRQRKRPLAA